MEDLMTIWSQGTINMNPELVRLSKWAEALRALPKANSCPIWIRLMELLQKYRHGGTLREFDIPVGTSLIIDTVTQEFSDTVRVPYLMLIFLVAYLTKLWLK